MHATRRNSGVMGMSERKDDGEREQPKGLFYFEQIDILLIVAIIAVVGTIIIMIASAIPHDGYWPKNFAEIIDIVYTLALIVGGAMTLIFAAARLNDGAKESRRKDREEVERNFNKAIEFLEGAKRNLSLYGASRMQRLAEDYPEIYLETAIRLIGLRAGRTEKHAKKIEDAAKELPETDQDKAGSKKRLERTREPARELAEIAAKLAALYEKREKKKSPLDLSGINLFEMEIANITVTPSLISGCDLTGVTFQGCTFEDTFWEGPAFKRVTFDKCTTNFASWVRCDLFSARFIELKIIDNYSKLDVPLDVPQINKILFCECNLGNAKFSFPQSEDFLNSTEHSGARNNYLKNDFVDCHIGVACRPPDGLEQNRPPMAVVSEVENENVPTPISIRILGHNN